MTPSTSTIEKHSAAADGSYHAPRAVVWIGCAVLLGIAAVAGWQSASHAFPTVRPAHQSEPASTAIPVDQSRFLGISVEPLNESIVAQYKLGKSNGVIVRALTPHTPWTDAGLRVGDVILVLGSHPIRSEAIFEDAIQSLRIGPREPIEIVRDGMRITLSLQFDPHR